MTFCFRIRFVLPDRVTIEADVPQLKLGGPEDGDVVLRAPLPANSPEPTIGQSKHLIVLGRGYATEAKAQEAGKRWHQTLQRAFARMNIGADFGKRARPSGTSDWLRDQAFAAGHRLVDDVHGLMTFEEDPWPTFIGVGGIELSTGRPVQHVLRAIDAAARLRSGWSDKEETAFDLYAASFFVSIDDARFTMLMMALETLMEPEPRSREAQELVDELIARTETTELPDSEKRSLVGSLRFLKGESVRHAGLRLVDSLGARQYAGDTARHFFDSMYELRSALVHGAHPRPAQTLVNASVAELERLVSDLLSLELLEEDES